jgi:hypothetical protein
MNSYKPIIILFGAHRWNRQDVVRYAYDAGLRVILAYQEDQIDEANATWQEIPHEREHIPIKSHTAQGERTDNIEEYILAFNKKYGQPWYTLGLDDYVCELAARFSQGQSRRSFPPQAAIDTLCKHRLREYWNRYCSTNRDAPLHTVPYSFRQYTNFDAKGDFQTISTPGFEQLSGPFIVKPDATAASLGVCIAHDLSEVESKVRSVLGSLTPWVGNNLGVELYPNVMIESEIPRSSSLHAEAEFSVEILSLKGKHQLIGITEKLLYPNTHVEAGHIFPSPRFPDDLKPILERAFTDLLRKLKVSNCISHWECIVTPENRLALVEAQLRPGGDRIIDLIELSTGTNPYRVLFNSFVDSDFHDDELRPYRQAMIFYLTPQIDLASVEDIQGEQEAQRELPTGIIELSIPRDRILSNRWGRPTSSVDRPAHIIAYGSDVESTRKRCQKIIEQIKLIGCDKKGNRLITQLQISGWKM